MPPPPDFLAKAREIVATQKLVRDSRRVGVSWSGVAPDAPKVETVAEVEARLIDHDAKAAAFARSPRGRFLNALNALETEYPSETIRLRGFYYRSLTTLNGPELNTQAVGDCLLILNPLCCPAAREASDALAELLIAEGMKLAA